MAVLGTGCPVPLSESEKISKALQETILGLMFQQERN